MISLLDFVLSKTKRTVTTIAGLSVHHFQPCLAQNRRLDYHPQVFRKKILGVLKLMKTFQLHDKHPQPGASSNHQPPFPGNHRQSLLKKINKLQHCPASSNQSPFVTSQIPLPPLKFHPSLEQLIMPPISKDCSNTFLERSFIYAAPCEWNKLSEHIRTSHLIVSGKVLKQCYLHKQYGCWL